MTRPTTRRPIGVMVRKTCLFACFLVLATAASANAQSVTLAWDANSEPYLAGYKVYRSQQSGIFGSSPINGTNLITATSFTDSTVTDGIYYYVVTAVATTGEESGYSDQVLANLDSAVTGNPAQEPDAPNTIYANVTTSDSFQGTPKKPKNVRRGKK